MDNTLINKMSWLADWHARSSSFAPKNWPATTAPPVAMAAKIWMMRIMMESTNDTADTADSPTLAIITVSIMPTVTVKSCSMISGQISFFKSLLLNNRAFFSCISINKLRLLYPDAETRFYKNRKR